MYASIFLVEKQMPRFRTLSVVTLALRFFTIFSTYWVAASVRSSIRFDFAQGEDKNLIVLLQGEGGVEETIHPFGFCYNPRLGKWTTTGLLIRTLMLIDLTPNE